MSLRRHSPFSAAFVLASILFPLAVEAAEFRGRVFLDQNQNGQADPGEPGLRGVLVSDGHAVVATDGDGRYCLASDETKPTIRVTVPRDHAARGGFWRHGRQEVAADFALVAQKQPDNFYFIQISDTHLGRGDLLRPFVERVNQFPLPLAFLVNTGDLGGGSDTSPPEKARRPYDTYIEAAAGFRVPLKNVPGNHEHVAHNVKDADTSHPWYGKGLYRELLGPMHYSWDYGQVHFVGLDTTTMPFQVKLGQRQLEWLAADLEHQPKGKPIVLFGHHCLAQLRDAKQLSQLLQGRKALAAFCGDLHATFTTNLDGLTIYQTGAHCGTWWSGPNMDGSPQGFRLIDVRGDRLQTVYSNREGHHSLYVSAPSASELVTGQAAIEVAVLDFGNPVDVRGRWAGRDVPLARASRQAQWSIWKGSLDTATLDDDAHELEVTATADGQATGTCRVRYLVVNGRHTPYQAAAAATLAIQVRAMRSEGEVLFNGKPLGKIAAGTPNETILKFPVPATSLQKLNCATVRVARPGKGNNNFSVGPISLEYQGKKIHDLRFPIFMRFSVGDSPSPQFKRERHCYFPIRN